MWRRGHILVLPHKRRVGRAEMRLGAKWTGGTICYREECHECGKERVPDPHTKHPRPGELARKQGHNQQALILGTLKISRLNSGRAR